MIIPICMSTGGVQYKIEARNYDKLERFVEHARDNMVSPCMFHLLSHICDVDEFKKSKRDLIKNFERGLKRAFKGSEQVCPNVQVAYSIEFKYTNNNEINGSEGAYEYKPVRFPIKVEAERNQPFLHLHFYVIADCNKTHPTTFKDKALASLNEIGGLRAGRYFVSNKGELYKKVKDNYDDCFQRILYIGKIDQKSDDIPFRKTFGSSKLHSKITAP